MQQRPDFLMRKPLQNGQAEHLPILFRQTFNQCHQIIVRRDGIHGLFRDILYVDVFLRMCEMLALLEIINSKVLHDDPHPGFQLFRIPKPADRGQDHNKSVM